MTRLQRLSPVLLGALMAACSEAQPYLQPVAPVAAQAVVVDAGLGDRTARLDLRAAAAYALQQAAPPRVTTVHRWVPADLVRYDVELRVRNATTATQFDAVGQGLTLQVPVGGAGVGTATFQRLRQGSFYRAYVKAMGKAGGANAQGTVVQMNAQATGDHVDFDFTAANDVAQEVSRSLTVNFDGVAFSGTGAVSFGSPSPGVFANPSEGPAVAVSNPPTPRPLPQTAAFYTVGSGPRGVAVDAQGNVWVANRVSNNLSKLASNGSVLATHAVGTNPQAVAIDGQGNVWATLAGEPTGSPVVPPRLVKLNSSGSVLGSVLVASGPNDVAVDAQGSAWVLSNSNHTVANISNDLSVVATFSVGISPGALAIDQQGNLWVGHVASSYVTKLASNGNLLGTFPVSNGAYDLAIDRQGQVWVPASNHNTVFQLASTGSLLAIHSISSPFKLEVDGEGRVWVGQTSGQLTVLSSQGVVLATHAMGFPGGIAVSSQGQVWLTRPDFGNVALFS